MKPSIVAVLLLLGSATVFGAAVAQTVGSASIGPMVGLQVRGADREAVVGGHASFGFNAGPWFLGPEYTLVQGSRTRVRAIGLVVRLAGRGERLRPLVGGGAGSYGWSNRYEFLVPSGQTVVDWAGINYLSGSIGGGVELGSRGRFNPMVEVRHHGNIQRGDAGAAGRGLVTAAVGVRYHW